MRIYQELTSGTFDLHIHTTASDGAYSPQDIVFKAKEAGLQTIAITDHDTVMGIEEARQTAEDLGIEVIAGVEISTRYQGKSVDILGYHIQNVVELHERLGPYRDDRESRALQIIEKFRELQMPITLEDVKEFSQDGIIARPHIAKAIVKKGYVPDFQTVFDQYLADGKPAAVEKKMLDPKEGIQMIHAAGGKAVLAHLALIGDDRLVYELLNGYKFDGIEIWHRKHTPQDTERYRSLAEQFQLAVTGGSDFHFDEHRLGNFINQIGDF